MRDFETLTGVVSPRRFTPADNFLAGGQARSLVEIDRTYDDSEVVWQEEVYIFARGVAEAQGATLVVDIGAGSGTKLYAAFAGHPAARLQTDWRDDRTAPPGNEAPAPFMAVNLEDFDALEALEAALDPATPTLFILSDVIEHLLDPRPLLRSLRRLLRRHPRNRLVISTPDRERIDGRRAAGLPDNSGHVRQWTLNEFGLAMQAAGFAVERIGRVPQNPFDTFNRTSCAELSCSDAYRAAWLRRHELPEPSDHLVLTTEHARAERTGGIGTYIQLAEEIEGRKRLIVFAGITGLPADDWVGYARRHGWMHVADMAGRPQASLAEIGGLDYEEILAAVQQAVFLYDEVRLLEYQDYCGIGHRVAQAKRAGLLPRSVTVLAYVHGTHLYLDAAAGTIPQERRLGLDARERLSIELADVVAFPSRYCRDLYVETGGFRLRATRDLRYPIVLRPTGLDDLSRSPIDTLVFYGKRTPQKGYPDFVDAVLALFADPAFADVASRVKRVVLMGTAEAEPRLDALPVPVEHGVWSRAEVVSMLNGFAPNGLVVLPYRGDNHPLSTFEVVDADCQLLAFAAGGLPEQVPAALHDRLLCAPNATALAQGIAKAMRLSHWARCDLIAQTRYLMREAYIGHAATYREAMAALKAAPPPAARDGAPGAITVIVPNLNGSAGYLADAALGLRNSFHRPTRVLLVDDGSTPEGLAVLEASVAAFGSLPVEIVRNPVNLGLAGARNAGLVHVDTPYVCAHDNDNIVTNRFLQIACRMLDENPDLAAVTTWSTLFDDGTAWQVASHKPGYRPIGADLGLALRTNILGDALAVYRVSVLRELGGWNATSKAKWEDWELFLRLTAAGRDVWIIPRESILYRVRPCSMLRTYSDFPGWLRLASGLPGLPKGQAVSLMRAIWTPSYEMGGELHPYIPALGADIQAELARLHAIETSATWRATTWIRRFFNDRPALRKVVRAPLAAAWRTARDIRNALRGR